MAITLLILKCLISVISIIVIIILFKTLEEIHNGIKDITRLIKERFPRKYD